MTCCRRNGLDEGRAARRMFRLSRWPRWERLGPSLPGADKGGAPAVSRSPDLPEPDENVIVAARPIRRERGAHFVLTRARANREDERCGGSLSRLLAGSLQLCCMRSPSHCCLDAPMRFQRGRRGWHCVSSRAPFSTPARPPLRVVLSNFRTGELHVGNVPPLEQCWFGCVRPALARVRRLQSYESHVLSVTRSLVRSEATCAGLLSLRVAPRA